MKRLTSFSGDGLFNDSFCLLLNELGRITKSITAPIIIIIIIVKLSLVEFVALGTEKKIHFNQKKTV
jgi:hypothetical protein